jgi:hypothetical protein
MLPSQQKDRAAIPAMDQPAPGVRNALAMAKVSGATALFSGDAVATLSAKDMTSAVATGLAAAATSGKSSFTTANLSETSEEPVSGKTLAATTASAMDATSAGGALSTALAVNTLQVVGLGSRAAATLVTLSFATAKTSETATMSATAFRGRGEEGAIVFFLLISFFFFSVSIFSGQQRVSAAGDETMAGGNVAASKGPENRTGRGAKATTGRRWHCDLVRRRHGLAT